MTLDESTNEHITGTCALMQRDSLAVDFDGT